ncbi:hypothetical protein PM082_022859 [Marasmius tenuissimus]|nr:hypothetical protein PM082_022859 [Marasmius tenuissimus]
MDTTPGQPNLPPNWINPGLPTIILYHSIGMICQTFFFGIYATLMIFSTYLMVTTGIKSDIRKYIFLMSTVMFVLSTLFWVSKMVDFIDLISHHLIHGQPPPTTTGPITHAMLVLGALVLINYVLTDAVVFWRAWVLCNPDYRRILYIPMVFLGCALTSVSSTIVIRIAMQSIPHMDGSTTDPRVKALTRAIDVCQIANIVFSLLLNLSTTILIAFKTWKFRAWIKSDLSALGKRRTKGEKIMVLLVESGSLYCLAGIILLASTLIRLPVGTLGNISTPVNIQIAGVYPIVVLLLVNHGKTLENTIFMQNIDFNDSRSPPVLPVTVDIAGPNSFHVDLHSRLSIVSDIHGQSLHEALSSSAGSLQGTSKDDNLNKPGG